MNILNFLEFIKESQNVDNITAVIALFNKNGKLLSLKRGMTAPWKPGYWNITGGVVGDNNPDESPKLAVVREVKEETGMTPKNIKEWGTVDTKDHPESCGLIYYFSGEVDEIPTSSDGENSDWKFIDRENLNKINWVPFLIDFKGCDLSNAKFKKSFLHEVWI